MSRLALVRALVGALGLSVATATRAMATDWGSAFPETKPWGSFDPAWAASTTLGNNPTPEGLIEDWQQLPDDLHQWTCGKDNTGYARRCLDETFRGSGKYVGKALVIHFDTIGGRWHLVSFKTVRD